MHLQIQMNRREIIAVTFLYVGRLHIYTHLLVHAFQHKSHIHDPLKHISSEPEEMFQYLFKIKINAFNIYSRVVKLYRSPSQIYKLKENLNKFGEDKLYIKWLIGDTYTPCTMQLCSTWII